MIRLAAIAPAFLLAACASPLADGVARDAAKATVNPIIASRFPGVPLEPATKCIIDNASAGEIVTFARSVGTGVDDAAARLVLDVASRPATIQCLATDGLPILLNAF